jgi:hypothetical protein
MRPEDFIPAQKELELSDAERAERLRNICRELAARAGEPDIAEQAIAALAPYFESE